MPELGHHVELVAAGPESLAWLSHTVDELLADDPARSVTVVAPSPYMASVLRASLATTLGANDAERLGRFDVQLRPIAERLARSLGSRAFDHPLTGPLEEAAIRRAIRDAASSTLGRLADNRSLQDALSGLFREIGHHASSDEVLASIARGGSVGAAASSVYRTYVTLTESYPDVPHQLRIAANLLNAEARTDDRPPSDPSSASHADDASSTPATRAHHSDPSSAPHPDASSTPIARAHRAAAALGALVVYLPTRLDPADLHFLRALAQFVPIRVALTFCGDTLADASLRETASALSAALHCPVAAIPTPHPQPATIHVLSAPDPDEETRSVIRRLLADMESGIPLARMAVLYTAEDPYGPLVRETLDSARRPLAHRAGSPRRRWSRRPLAPVAPQSAGAELRKRSGAGLAGVASDKHPGVTVDPLPDVPASAWDRLSRRAQVLQGADQWIARFERLVQTLELEEQQRQDWRAEARGHESTDKRPAPVTKSSTHGQSSPPSVNWTSTPVHLVTLPVGMPSSIGPSGCVASIFRTTSSGLPPTRTPRTPSTLPSTASALPPPWSLRRHFRYSGMPSRRHSPPADLTREIRASASWWLCSARVSAPRSIALSLSAWRRDCSRRDPAVDPIGGASTADGADPLGRTAAFAATERRAFLSALSGTVLLSYSRSDGAARAGYPSRWLLEQIALLESMPAVYASDLPVLFAEKRPWLEHFASAYDAILRAPAPLNLADRRLREVVAAHALGSAAAETAVARRTDLVLGRALRAARLRRSHAFTEFDGNLASFAAASRRIARPFNAELGASSATSIERWANCPYQYFMVNVLRVEATERPEEEWTMNALDRGTLVHAALEAFFRERQAAGRSTPSEPFGDADHARLQAIARDLLADLEAQGRSGHAVAWENARATLLRDLQLQLDREEEWRQEDALAPMLFERTFGDVRDTETWPAVEVRLDDGSVVRFRGAIDRVDVSVDPATGRRALVIDYKSGSTWGYDGLDKDPLLAGRHVQLALYGAAVAAALVPSLEAVRAEFRFVSARGHFERRGVLVDASVLDRLRVVVQHAANGIRAGHVPGDARRTRVGRIPELSVLRLRPHLLGHARRSVAPQEGKRAVHPPVRGGGMTLGDENDGSAANVTARDADAPTHTDTSDAIGHAAPMSMPGLADSSPTSAPDLTTNPPTSALALADADARRRITTDLDHTFFVEAGAGTGKTTALVSRAVNLIAGGRVTMEHLAAITFTEAAAAELRDRVREGLERAAAASPIPSPTAPDEPNSPTASSPDPQPDADAYPPHTAPSLDPSLTADTLRSPAARERCRVAAIDIDRAAISTIHAFAGQLLRTFPIEAGLAPGFVTLDEIQQAMHFDERFDRWFWRDALREPLRSVVKRALLLGLTRDTFRRLASALEDRHHVLANHAPWPGAEPPPALPVAQIVGTRFTQLQRAIPYALDAEADPLVQLVISLRSSARQLLSAQSEEDALSALLGVPRLRAAVEHPERWKDATDGRNAAQVILEVLAEMDGRVRSTLGAHRAWVLANLLGHLRDFVLEGVATRRADAQATFHDLLAWTRDLLRDNASVRHIAQQRFQRICIDEFQDTDPLQAEIAFYLAASEGSSASANALPVDWRDIRLVPGKLFVVGDPKQSIYRFRGADIGIYDDLLGRFADCRQRLTHNFRSVQPVLAWVNHHFDRHMQARSGVQPDYAPLAVQWPSHAEGAACGVRRVGTLVHGSTSDAADAEARALALLSVDAVRGGWQVSDTDTTTGLRTLRRATFRDICILLPARTHLHRLERALEELDVPFRLEAGKLILATQEVRDLLACLRAIEDPSDQVALVAALRSPAYACSDADLLEWVESGGRLDHERPRDATNFAPAEVESRAAEAEGYPTEPDGPATEPESRAADPQGRTAGAECHAVGAECRPGRTREPRN